MVYVTWNLTRYVLHVLRTCASMASDSKNRGQVPVNQESAAMPETRKPPVSEQRAVPIFGPGAAPLIDSNQAARFLGVHPRTLQRMVLRGEIAGVRVGKLWRFVPSAIQNWISEHNIAS